MTETKYKAAYERQKKARESAEKILEEKSRELYEANQSLIQAYNNLKDQKAQLLHQEKLASIGQLAAGVAHEINNPTGFVKSNLQTLATYTEKFSNAIESYEALLKDRSKEPEAISKQIEHIREKCDLDFIIEDINELVDESLEGANRIEDIVSGLKTFSRPDSGDNEEFSLNECIENTLKLVTNEVKYKADVSLKLDDIPNITGKAGAISQVILNLIVNAADAIENHGNINISTSCENQEIKLRISDNGTGIPQNLITKIFDPFFTTKDVGKGTGLGLAISHNIVKKHKGRMLVCSEQDKGTEFTIYFPQVAALS